MPVAALLSIDEQQLSYQWFTENGEQRHTASVDWAAVRSIDVFKRDFVSYDLICLRLILAGGVVVEFDEEDPGWTELMGALPLRLPGCRAWGDWFATVAFPAFEEKFQRIFNREEA